MTKLLIEEYPLLVLPSLAEKVGLSEAIVIQQLHYWINHKKQDGSNLGKWADGKRWIRNTVEEWRENNFPFWSEKTIRNIFTRLENKGYVISRNDLNKLSFDRTKWYSIDYDFLHLEEITEWNSHSEDFTGSEAAKTTKSDMEEITDTIPETTTEITKETTTDFSRLSGAIWTVTGIPAPNPGTSGWEDWESGIERLIEMGATKDDILKAKTVLDEKGYTYSGPNSFVKTIANLKKKPPQKRNNQSLGGKVIE